MNGNCVWLCIFYVGVDVHRFLFSSGTVDWITKRIYSALFKNSSNNSISFVYPWSLTLVPFLSIITK